MQKKHLFGALVAPGLACAMAGGAQADINNGPSISGDVVDSPGASNDVYHYFTFAGFTGGAYGGGFIYLPYNSKTVTGVSVYMSIYDSYDGGPSSFPGDMKVDLFAPDGQYFSVGGFDTYVQGWDYVNYGNGNTYEYNSGQFNNAPKGYWYIRLTNDWASSSESMYGSGLIIFHKIPAPGALGLLGVAGLLAAPRRRRDRHDRERVPASTTGHREVFAPRRT